MVIIFLSFWIILALIVFFAAMRSGSQGGPGKAGRSKAAKRLLALGITILILFGLAVPAIVLAFNGAHKSEVAVGGVQLTAKERAGRELFAHTCAVCHSLAAVQSYARVGPNLDVKVGEQVSTPAGRKALVEGAIAEGRARGLGQMPALLYQGKEAEEVADFVAAVAGH
jgi:mono/diheme cytochrome c family protein